MKRALLVVLFAGLLLPGASLRAVDIDGNVATDSISLAGGVELDLTITFESVTGLTATNLGLTVELADASELVTLATRLPGTLTTIPAAFPVLIEIEPSSLDFDGTVSIELHTHNLDYTAATPLRLFSAHDGGDFEDITTQMGVGSYRVRGAKGGFSEFLVISDLRTSGTVIDDKFTVLQDLLDDHDSLITTQTAADLQDAYDDAETEYDTGDSQAAADFIEDFIEIVIDNSGSDIDDTWTSAGTTTNAAGELRAAAETLRLSLLLDVNLGT